MLRSVFTKTIWERRWAMLGWVLGGLALTLVMVAVYPIVRDSDAFTEAIESLPPELLAISGIDPELFSTGVGFLQGQMYSLLAPLLVLVLALGIGASATAAEEASGTADLLLATPVTRRRVVLDKSSAMVVLVGALVLSIIAGLLIGEVTVDLELSIEGIVGINLGLLLLGLFFGAMAMTIGAWTGKRTPAAAVAGGIAGVAFIVDSFAPLVDFFETLQPFSPFHWYNAGDPLLNGPTGDQLLLAAGVVLFTALAVPLFQHRDLGVFSTFRLLPQRTEKANQVSSSTSRLLGTIGGKEIWTRRRSFWWWLAGIGLIAVATISVFPSFDEGGDVWTELLEAYPPELLAMFGITDVDSLLTGAGLVSSRVYSGIGLIVVLAFAIGIGKAALAGEEKSGTADLLLSTPPTRDRVVIDKATSMMMLLLGLMAGVALIVWLGDLAVGLDLSAEGLAAANLGMAVLAFLFGSLALAVGAGTGKPGLAIGVASGIGVALFLLNGFGAIIDWLEPFRVLSPFYWYQGDTNPLDQTLGWQQPLLLAVGLALVGASVFLFRRRDIGT
jgi:ABC-2 type transport system permease protein